MAAVANIVLADAQATPVNHTFIPIGPDAQGTWWWEDQSGSASIAYNRISMNLKRASNPAAGSNAGTRMNRVSIGIHTPVLETLGTNDAGYTPAPTVAYIPRVMIEFVLPDRASLAERKDIRKYADYLLANAQMVSAIEDLQNVY